jgi:phosphoribosylamine---glycine ligase
MNILIIGTNALSHYLAEILAKESIVENIYHPNFNKPIKNNSFKYFYFPLNLENDDFKNFIFSKKIDLIIPTEHRYQLFKNFRMNIEDQKIPVLMPSFQIALLEWSKIESKKFLQSLNIPTAPCKIFTFEELIDCFLKIPRPFVLKFDQDWRAGLQTKIVTDENVFDEFDVLKKEGQINYYGVNRYTKKQYFLIENFIKGKKEYSYHVLSNSTGWIYLGSARDYKKRFENDFGYNTSSCGSYAMVEDVDPRITDYVNLILNKFKSEGTPYVGILYLGILIDENDNPIILEINTRAGDPEFNCICPLINESIAKLLHDCATNKPLKPVSFSNKKSVSLRIINKDYSLKYLREKENNPPKLPLSSELSINFNKDRGLFYCVITSTDETIQQASDNIYNFLKNKDMGNYTFRKDIGKLL